MCTTPEGVAEGERRWCDNAFRSRLLEDNLIDMADRMPMAQVVVWTNDQMLKSMVELMQ